MAKVKKLRWSHPPYEYSKWDCFDELSRRVGHIEHLLGEHLHRAYLARYLPWIFLGDYLSEDAAKAAVEKAVGGKK